MCLTCGCMRPNDDMGDEHNIIMDDIKASVQTSAGAGLTPEEAVKNLIETWAKKVSTEDKSAKLEQKYN